MDQKLDVQGAALLLVTDPGPWVNSGERPGGRVKSVLPLAVPGTNLTLLARDPRVLPHS